MAFAHPALSRSEPAAGAKVKSIESVSLWFTEKIEPVFHRIEIVDAAGAHFEEGKATIDSSDKSLLRLRLKPLPAGSYRVRWRVSGGDTHKMEGSFAFEVAP